MSQNFNDMMQERWGSGNIQDALYQWLAEGGGGEGASTADAVSYDNGSSGLAADDVQAALDELAGASVALEYPRAATIWGDECKVITGSALSIPQHSDHHYGIEVVQGVPANGDVREWRFYLEAGSYVFGTLGITHAAAGIVDWTLDGSALVTGQDWYTVSTDKNVRKSSNVTVATSGHHTLRSTVNGKNASSSTYHFSHTKSWFRLQ